MNWKTGMVLLALTGMTGLAWGETRDDQISLMAKRLAKSLAMKDPAARWEAHSALPNTGASAAPQLEPLPPPGSGQTVNPAFGGAPPYRSVPMAEDERGRLARNLAKELTWGGRAPRADVKYAPPKTPAGSKIYPEDRMPKSSVEPSFQ